MALGLGELLVVALTLGLVGFVAWFLWTTLAARLGAGTLPARQRAELAAAIGAAHWAPAHDEVDGVTRVLVRRSYTGLDGRPVVLEERVLETIPANDPAWEVLFTEAMAKARFRSEYLNAEERP